MSLATSSLPVPLSPVMSTDTLDSSATSTTSLTNSRQRGLAPARRSRTSGESAGPSTLSQ